MGCAYKTNEFYIDNYQGLQEFIKKEKEVGSKIVSVDTIEGYGDKIYHIYYRTKK